MLAHLRQPGASLSVIPEGIAGIFLAQDTDRETIFLSKRKGFVKLAIQSGAGKLSSLLFEPNLSYPKPFYRYILECWNAQRYWLGNVAFCVWRSAERLRMLVVCMQIWCLCIIWGRASCSLSGALRNCQGAGEHPLASSGALGACLCPGNMPSSPLLEHQSKVSFPGIACFQLSCERCLPLEV